MHLHLIIIIIIIIIFIIIIIIFHYTLIATYSGPPIVVRGRKLKQQG